jgi:hypothetical protein
MSSEQDKGNAPGDSSTPTAKRARRRINLDRLADKVLFALHDAALDDKHEWVSFAYLRRVLPNDTPNAIRLDLELLVRNDDALRDSDTRFKANPSLYIASLSQSQFRYEVDADRYKISKSGIEKIEKLTDEQYEWLAREVRTGPAPPPPSDLDDEWQPIPIDRTTPQAIDAIDKSESALREIEQSNGYAASDPDERNSIVETIRGTLATLKSGIISRKAIIAGLLAPFRYIAKKFGEATLGEAAKTAASAIVKWLTSLA